MASAVFDTRNFQLTSQAATDVPLTIIGSASQTSSLLNIRNSASTNLFTVQPDARLQLNPNTDITPTNTVGNSHFSISGNGYGGFISLDQTGMWVGHNSASRSVILATNETERMRITSAGNVGIGTTPSYKLHMYDATDSSAYISSDGVAGVTVARASTDATGPYVVMRKARGTQASPSIVSSGDLIGGLAWQALDTTVYRNAAQILCEVDGTPGATDMPARLRFLITPDGSATMSERMRIDSAGLITGTGSSLGAWTVYTPTLTGSTTDPTLGTGSTAEGYYVQIGKIVHVYLRIVFGTSGTSNGSGNYNVSLPVTAKTSGYNQTIGVGEIFDSSAGVRKIVHVSRANSTALQMRYPADTTGNLTLTAATAPWTWAASDAIYLAFTYEAA